VAALLAFALVVAGCSDGDEDIGAERGSTDATTTEAASADPGDCEATVDTAEIDYRSTDELTDLERQTIELFRAGSGPLLQAANPVSCRGLDEAPTQVEAAEVGAFEAKSFVHTDPEVRYDLFYFTERQPAEATVRDEISARVTEVAGEGTTVEVWSVGGTLFVATTIPSADETAPLLTAHYDQVLAGEE
jgi:hypothetical protein